MPVFLVGTKKDLLRDEEVMKRASEDKSTIITLEEVGRWVGHRVETEDIAKEIKADANKKSS